MHCRERTTVSRWVLVSTSWMNYLVIRPISCLNIPFAKSSGAPIACMEAVRGDSRRMDNRVHLSQSGLCGVSEGQLWLFCCHSSLDLEQRSRGVVWRISHLQHL